MNLILVAVFAACASTVYGRVPKDKKENNSTSAQNSKDAGFSSRWPQIIIIKAMELPKVSFIGPLKRPVPYYQHFQMYRPPVAADNKTNLNPPSTNNYDESTSSTSTTSSPERTPSTPTTSSPERTPSTPTTSSPERTSSTPTTSSPERTSSTPTTSSPERTSSTPTTSSPERYTTTETGSNGATTPETEMREEIDTVESSCQTPNSGPGDCISVYDCKPLLDLINKKDRTSQDIDLLKKSQCGYSGSTPRVCCPRPPPKPANGNCFTPEGNAGSCISLYSCQHLADMLKPPVTNQNIAYVQQSRCDGIDKYSVCCGLAPNRSTGDIVVGNCAARISAIPADPRTECCGVDSRVGNKIVGGNATTVDQYPWLAVIEYVKQGVTKLLCGGALISSKYVLTAGHCVAGQVLQAGTPRKVRLGEYDISHDGPDCAPVEAGGQDCTEGVTRITIDKTIPHPDYNPVHVQKRNDIALIRLVENAPYTDFIRPICLPTKDLTKPENVPINFTLYAAGWGAVSTKQSFSNIKLHVDLPFVSQDRCQPAYSAPGRTVTLWQGQMCAGGVTEKDSCKGDSGGPLMYENGRTFEVIGIVSFGPLPCGMDGIPGVYSKVYEYLPWIKSTIVP